MCFCYKRESLLGPSLSYFFTDKKLNSDSRRSKFRLVKSKRISFRWLVAKTIFLDTSCSDNDQSRKGFSSQSCRYCGVIKILKIGELQDR